MRGGQIDARGQSFGVRDALSFAAIGAARARRRGIDHVRFTIPQVSFLSDDRQRVLWRDGNQMGKSYALAYDVLARCRGSHLFQKVRRPPISVLVVSVSFEQMAPLMEKIWALAPKDELDPRCGYDPGRGITGKPARLVFSSGPGRGSVITFATYKQGASRIAGGTYDIVIMDEPPTQGIYGEIMPRVAKRRGLIRIGMTPTPDMPPQGWLRELVSENQVHEHNFGLSAKHCQPRGHPTPWLFQHEIDEYLKGLLRVERQMRERGAWDPVVEGRWLDGFDDECITSEEARPGAFLVCGIDHGADAGKQRASLVALEGRRSSRPRGLIWDEAGSDGFTTPEMDAKAILSMLHRRGLMYDSVDAWVGDRSTKSDKRNIRKGNNDLRRELALQLNRPLHQTKIIADVKKWAGSMSYGMRLLNTLFVRRDEEGPHLKVHERCVNFIEGCREFDGDPKHPTKDALDGGRYAVEHGVNSAAALSLVAHY